MDHTEEQQEKMVATKKDVVRLKAQYLYLKERVSIALGTGDVQEAFRQMKRMRTIRLIFNNLSNLDFLRLMEEPEGKAAEKPQSLVECYAKVKSIEEEVKTLVIKRAANYYLGTNHGVGTCIKSQEALKTHAEINARLAILFEQYRLLYETIAAGEIESAYMFGHGNPEELAETIKIRSSMVESGFMVLQSIVHGSADMRIKVEDEVKPWNFISFEEP